MNVTIIALDDINVIEIIIVKVIARWTGRCVELFILYTLYFRCTMLIVVLAALQQDLRYSFSINFKLPYYT